MNERMNTTYLGLFASIYYIFTTYFIQKYFVVDTDVIRHPATLLYTYTTHCCIEKLLRAPPPAPVSKICQQIGCSCATGLATSCLVWKLSVVWPWPWADLVTSTYLWSIVTIRLEAECDHPLLAFSWHICTQFCLNISHENDSGEDCRKYRWFPVDINWMYQYIPLGGPEY